MRLIHRMQYSRRTMLGLGHGTAGIDGELDDVWSRSLIQ